MASFLASILICHWPCHRSALSLCHAVLAFDNSGSVTVDDITASLPPVSGSIIIGKLEPINSLSRVLDSRGLQKLSPQRYFLKDTGMIVRLQVWTCLRTVQ